LTARSPVVVLEADCLPSIPVRSARIRLRHELSSRNGILIAVLAAHAGLAWLLVSLPAGLHRRVETEALVSVFIRPLVVVSRDPLTDAALPRAIRVRRDAPLSFGAPTADFDRPAITAIGVGTMAPTVADVDVDSRPFARAAGLKPGEGVTVVVRIEVLGSGELGRVTVDMSGGSTARDEAAIAYARSLTWIGGLIDGQPATLWLRWGIRLQG
jgi:hypothetical protein